MVRFLHIRRYCVGSITELRGWLADKKAAYSRDLDWFRAAHDGRGVRRCVRVTRRTVSPAVQAMPTTPAVATIPVPSRDVLTGNLRDGDQRLLAKAIGAEVDDWITRHAGLQDVIAGVKFINGDKSEKKAAWLRPHQRHWTIAHSVLTVLCKV